MFVRRGPQPILREAARLCLLLFAVSVVTFLLVGASPIDPVQANVGQVGYLSMSAERRAVLEARWGVDEPIWSRYAAWAAGALRGDLGTSLRFNAPVVQVVGERLASSAGLLLAAWSVSGLLGLVLGVLAGSREGSLLDRGVRTICYLLAATPAFWLALLALTVFGVWLGWFPLGFSVPLGASAGSVTLADRLHHMVLPALVLSIAGVSGIALHTREKTIEVLSSDYTRFARARGESGWTLLRRHGLRNLVMPAVMLQCASIGEVVGGSVLIEEVFSYPGLGQAAVAAALGGDAPLLVGIALATSLIVFIGNLIANVLQGVVDPRVRAGASHG